MAVEKENEVELSPDDEFAQAFGQAVAEGTGEDPPAEDKQPDTDPDKKDPPTEEKDPDKDEDKAGQDAPQGDGQKAGEDPPKDEPTQPQGNPQITELTEAIKTAIAARQAPAEPNKDDKVDEQRPVIPEPSMYEYTEEEKKVLDSYAKDWDDHDKAWKIREKKLTHDLKQELSYKFTLALGDVLQKIEQGLAPLYEGHVESAQARHFSAIREVHPDYDQVKPAVQEWIKQQPKYLQPHLQKTYDEGTTSDVIELISNFKTASGSPPPKPQGTQSGSRSAPKKDEVPAHKAAELAPVDTKRTAVQPSSSGTVDKNDFDAGFDEALAAHR